MMRKSILMGLSIAMLLTACGKEEKGNTNQPDNKPDNPQEQPDNKPEEDNKTEPQGLEAVDLGLSVAWSSCNVGATYSHEAGYGFAWGEAASKEDYSWSNYRWGKPATRYNQADGVSVLYPEDDAAAVVMGEQWRTPTREEWEELISKTNTEWSWTREQEVNGYRVKSLKNGKSIFLPVTDGTSDGLYWSASLDADDTQAGSVIFGNSSAAQVSPSMRFFGLNVRPVQGADFRIITRAQSLSYNAQTLEVEVVSSLGYKISSLPEWMTEAGSDPAGLNRKIHRFSVEANEGESSRSGVIVFCNDNSNCVPFSVTQKSLVPEITVNQASLSFSFEEASALLEIGANVAWTASSTADWCQAVPASGNGDAQVTVQVGFNEQREARTAQITFASEDGKVSQTVSVTQAANTGAGVQVDWSKSFYHRSLVMRFTATWCSYCPNMASSVKRAMELVPDKLVPLNLHGYDSTLEFDEVGSLMSQYAINGYPTGVVDGRQQVSNGNVENTAKRIVSILNETEANYPTASGISLSSELKGDELGIDLYLYLRYADDYRVTVLLMESGIIAGQEDYYDSYHSSYQHDNVARLSLTNVRGDSFSTTADQSVKHLEYSVSVPSGYNRDNLSVLVYVQRAYGKQTVIRSGNYGDFYVDNAVVAAVGEELKPAYAD